MPASSSSLALVVALVLAAGIAVRADPEVGAAGDGREVVIEAASPSPLELEIVQLKSKISELESKILEQTNDLKGKDDNILRLENAIQDKSAKIVSLQSEVEFIQKKSAADVEELVGRAHARAHEFEKQVETLKKELETESNIRDSLIERATEADKRAKELNAKLESVGDSLVEWATEADKTAQELNAKIESVETLKKELEREIKIRDSLVERAAESDKKAEELIEKLESVQKTTADLKRKVQKTERALQVAEEELTRVQLQALSKLKELTEVHGAWLPPWLIRQWAHYQDRAAVHWNDHGKPTLDVFMQQVYEKSALAQKWAEPHFEAAKSKWIPAVKDHWTTFSVYVEPHVHKISHKSIEFYELSKSAVTPSVLKVQAYADPYFQEARKLSGPYIDHVVSITKPHVEKVLVILKPHTENAVYLYAEFLKSATTYHQQVQAAVQEKLKNHPMAKSLATKELVWFMASALLALPVLFLFKLFSAVLCKKARKPARTAQTSHANRRHKRRHADK